MSCYKSEPQLWSNHILKRGEAPLPTLTHTHTHTLNITSPSLTVCFGSHTHCTAAIRDYRTLWVLWLVWLLEEAKQQGIPILNIKPKVHCKVEEVRKRTISIYHTKTEDKIADIFTKPLPEASFTKFRERMMGW
jgi:hypothetical protein